jgi:transcriptional regulator with XRE-family HTH domain
MPWNIQQALKLFSNCRIMKTVIGKAIMTPEQAHALGDFIRERRLTLGISQRELARRAGVADVVRIEQGILLNPRAESLRALAHGLDVPLNDLFAIADWLPQDELPTLTPYLRAKYKELPQEAVNEMERFFTRLARRHGVHGPADGEDER